MAEKRERDPLAENDEIGGMAEEGIVGGGDDELEDVDDEGTDEDEEEEVEE